MRVGRSAKRKVGYTRNSFSRGVGLYIRGVLKIRNRISDLVYYLAVQFFGLISEPIVEWLRILRSRNPLSISLCNLAS